MRERERERENLFVRENYAKNGKEWQIYSKREGIRRNKIKEEKRKKKEWYQDRMFGEMKR